MNHLSKNVKRSIISVLSLGLVACGSQTSDEVAEVSDVGRGATDAYEEKITVTSVLQDVYGKNADPFTESQWGTDYLEMLNIELDVTANIPIANYNERLNTLIASDSLPDFFRVDQMSMYEQLVEDGLLYDMSEAYDEFASDELKAFTEANGGLALEGMKEDGQLFGIPVAGNEKSLRPHIYIRKDWLEELNLEVPKTIDDIWNVARAFKDNKMGGEGTIGVPLDNGLIMLQGMLSAYGNYRDSFHIDTDGKLAYTSTADEMETMLATLGELYGEGVIDQEFVTKDREKVYEEIKAGKIGIWFDDVSSGPRVVQVIHDSGTLDAEFMAISIPDKEGNVAVQDLPTRAGAIWVVTKNAKNPEALIKLMNYTINKWNSLETDEEFSMYNYNNPNGQNGYTGFPIGGIPEATMRWARQQEYYEEKGEFSEELLTDTEEKVRIQNVIKYKENPEQYPEYKYYEFQNSSTGASAALYGYEEADAYAVNYYQGLGSPTYLSKKSILDKTEYDYFIGIISGDKDSSSFAEFKKYWYENGGTQITEEVNAWFEGKDFTTN